MNDTDVQAILAHLVELRTIGYWLASLLAINAGLLAANIVAATIQIRIGR